MKIWVDADGCPARIRSIVEKASLRTGVESVFVSDRPMPVRENETVSVVRVQPGEDRSDDHILQHSSGGDLAVTRDVLLTERLVEKGVLVLDDRGGVYTRENIRERVSERERMMEFRSMGIFPEKGREALGEREIKAFAAAFDRELSRLIRDRSE